MQKFHINLHLFEPESFIFWQFADRPDHSALSFHLFVFRVGQFHFADYFILTTNTSGSFHAFNSSQHVTKKQFFYFIKFGNIYVMCKKFNLFMYQYNTLITVRSNQPLYLFYLKKWIIRKRLFFVIPLKFYVLRLLEYLFVFGLTENTKSPRCRVFPRWAHHRQHHTMSFLQRVGRIESSLNICGVHRFK